MMTINTINNAPLTIETFRQFVGSTIFNVSAYTKSGELRNYTARLGVESHTNGGRPEATAKRNETLKERNMVTIFLMDKMQYRTLDLNKVVELRANGWFFQA